MMHLQAFTSNPYLESLLNDKTYIKHILYFVNYHFSDN